MMTATHPLTADYLRRLEEAARLLPRRERDELVAQIREHLATGCPPDATEADIRNVLEELGSPEDIVAAAGPERPPMRRGAREAFALILLVTGLPPLIGWLVGAGLLLWSPLWTGRQKLLGLLVWPGGYVVALGAVGVSSSRDGSCPVSGTGDTASCTASSGPPVWSIVAVIVFLVAPLLVAAYLYRAAGRATSPQ
jgi:hypothetical protein